MRCRALLDDIAHERVREELTKLLCGQNAGRVLEEYAPVAAQVLPEIAPTFGFDQRTPWHDKDVWHHTLAAVDAAPEDPVLRWAALLHDLGKPPCFTLDEKGVGHFYDHGEESANRRLLPRQRSPMWKTLRPKSLLSPKSP